MWKITNITGPWVFVRFQGASAKNVGDIKFNGMENYLNRWHGNKLKNTKNREIELWRINARKQSARFQTRSFVDKLVFSSFSTCQTLNVVCLFTQKNDINPISHRELLFYQFCWGYIITWNLGESRGYKIDSCDARWRPCDPWSKDLMITFLFWYEQPRWLRYQRKNKVPKC